MNREYRYVIYDKKADAFIKMIDWLFDEVRPINVDSPIDATYYKTIDEAEMDIVAIQKDEGLDDLPLSDLCVRRIVVTVEDISGE